ncbi:MAG: AAA family ATPase [candidate division WOR-3 bacterium]|nr:AAA family ATPase [candidate division WOR-3 bacterium]
MFRVNMPNKIFQSKALKEVKRKILDAISEPGGILAIIGEIGIGKTIATIDALAQFEELGHNIIWCRQLDKENLKIGIIVSAMIRHFSELPRKDIDARTEQLRRLLGNAYANDQKTILVIDESHALHHSTLRSLKRLL